MTKTNNIYAYEFDIVYDFLLTDTGEPTQRLLKACDFDSDLCSFSQSREDNTDWTRQTRATPTSSTGPGEAAQGSHYIFLEASGLNQGDRAVWVLQRLN